MSACLLIGGKAVMLAASLFTLGWTHSVEKTRWVETWRIEDGHMRLIEARVKGSGAGMEPGENAVLRHGWWVWPMDRALPSLMLARSSAVPAGWRLCSGGRCKRLTGEGPLEIRPCTR